MNFALHTQKERARELAEVVLVAVILALFVRTFLVQAFVVPTGSMEPTLLVGDHVLVNKFLYAPRGGFLSALLPYRDVRRGDIIVFKFPIDPTHDYIKRAVALPGDTLEIRDGGVTINGIPEAPRRWPILARPPAKGTDNPRMEKDRFERLLIPPGRYFAMGDNRDNSYDSRSWGPVPAENLKGRALLIYWSFDGDRIRWSGNPIRWIADFVHRTRWPRTMLPAR